MSRLHGIQGYSTQEAQNVKLGQAGYEIVERTAATGISHSTEGHYIALTVLTDNTAVTATNASFYQHGGEQTDSIVVEEVGIGITMYGRWKAVSVSKSTSGAEETDARIILYKG